VHAEADRLEHSLSEELERRIDAALGHPTHDPHGHPIPDANLELARTCERTVLDLELGERAAVAHGPDSARKLRRYLAELGPVPGCEIVLTALAPFDGPVTLRSASGDHALSRELAGAIGVGS